MTELLEEEKKIIKPCPYCGETKNFVLLSSKNNKNGNRKLKIKCGTCHAEGPRIIVKNSVSEQYMAKNAIKMWNHRVIIEECGDSVQIKNKKFAYILKSKQLLKILRDMPWSIKKKFHWKSRKKQKKEKKKDLVHKNDIPIKQKVFLEELKSGDIVYALMPLPDDELDKIEEGHKERPYLIVKREKDGFVAYQCGGNKYTWMKSYEYCRFSQSTYNNSKEGYFHLNKVVFLPVERIRYKMNSLYSETLKKIEKRLKISQYYGHEMSLFEVDDIDIEVGDIILLKNELYLIYSCYKKEIYAYKVYKTVQDVDSYPYYQLLLNERLYYVSYMENKLLSIDEDFQFVDLLANPATIEKIQEYRKLKMKEERAKEKKVKSKKDVKHYSFKYPLGTVFVLGMTDYIYLCHINNKKDMYCVVRENGEYSDRPQFVPFSQFLSRYECLELDKIIILIEQMINNQKDHYGVLKEIRNDLCLMEKEKIASDS